MRKKQKKNKFQKSYSHNCSAELNYKNKHLVLPFASFSISFFFFQDIYYFNFAHTKKKKNECAEMKK